MVVTANLFHPCDVCMSVKQMFSVTERKPAFTSLKVDYEPRTIDIYYLYVYLKSILYLLAMTSTSGACMY